MRMNPSDLSALDRAICGEVWASDAIARNLETLCLQCGGRFAGSEAYRRAAEMVADWWRGYGLSDVRLEPFPCVAWERGGASLAMTAPAERAYPCLALPYAPACDLAGEMLDLGYGAEADFAAAGDAVAGKIVLTRSGAAAGQRPMHRLEKYIRARQAGALAFIFADDQPGMLAPTGSLALDQDGALDQALPSVGIAQEVGLELARWARGNGQVRLHLRLDNRLWRGESWNVIGELPAADPTAPLILVGGHLDGHDIAQAAIDNASGVAAVTEVGRVLAGLRAGSGRPLIEPMSCGVRFICFGVEELGMVGSYAYAAAHEAEMDRIRFFFNLDCVAAGSRLGLNLQNCSELAPLFRSLGVELAAELDVVEHLVPFSDHLPFTLAGVPAAFIVTTGDRAAGRGWGHTAADTLDKVNIASVRLAAAGVGRLVARLASGQTEWPGRRRTPDEVKTALQASGAEPLLRLLAAWPF
ncbi:MAG: M28 family peptidase [Chloroflexi bacterium]|nr:M28 family peptidase [Chloroflexota bacterium]